MDFPNKLFPLTRHKLLVSQRTTSKLFAIFYNDNNDNNNNNNNSNKVTEGQQTDLMNADKNRGGFLHDFLRT